MKYSHKELLRGNLISKEHKFSEMDFEVEIYADKKLTKKEIENQVESARVTILTNKENALLVEKGDVVSSVELFILSEGVTVPKIDQGDLSSDSLHKGLIELREFGSKKSKKKIIVVIKKI